jgi:hypothetical protein
LLVNWRKHLVACALTGAVLTVASLSGPKQLLAQAARAALMKDVDQPARQPFQTTVTVNLNNFNYTNVPVPAGKRLVVEFLAIAGAASSASGPIQPLILLNSSVAGSPSVNYYIQMMQSVPTPTQYYFNGPVKIYADTLSVGFGFAGYTPSFLAGQVQISGHLIDIP